MSEAFQFIPDSFARRHRIAPVGLLDDGALDVITGSQPEAAVVQELAFLTGRRVHVRVVAAEQLNDFFRDAVEVNEEQAPEPANGAVQRLERVSQLGRKRTTRPLSTTGGSVVQQVDRLIENAIDEQASDIHVEPYETSFRVRYRLDGVLHTVQELSLTQKEAVISRLKIMASLDIAEKRRPQDGRIRHSHRQKVIDLRVSTLPTDHGEKVVLRILDKSHLRLDLDSLGFSSSNIETFRRAIHLPFGMVLVTGPTGSGKTTTLYAALNELNTDDVNITTIEDPVEYNLAGINQAHARSDIGFTFAQAMRSFLRQDPNIIMVGEIRDRETAEIAIRAALTGHLVLTTLHTNDAPSAVTRLVDMGVEPYLAASSVRLVVAQRLVRRICADCRKKYSPKQALLNELELEVGKQKLYHGEGCATCKATGYHGRIALFEMMPIDGDMADLISKDAGLREVQKKAADSGMRSLREEALRMMREGLTTPDEVIRETMLW